MSGCGIKIIGACHFPHLSCSGVVYRTEEFYSPNSTSYLLQCHSEMMPTYNAQHLNCQKNTWLLIIAAPTLIMDLLQHQAVTGWNWLAYINIHSNQKGAAICFHPICTHLFLYPLFCSLETHLSDWNILDEGGSLSVSGSLVGGRVWMGGRNGKHPVHLQVWRSLDIGIELIVNSNDCVIRLCH